MYEISLKEPEVAVESAAPKRKGRKRKKPERADSKPEEKPAEEEAKKPQKKRKRNALEMLQDDIRDMFICEGVLTASGHRMCRILREQEEQLKKDEVKKPEKAAKKKEEEEPEEEPPKARRKPGPKSKREPPKEPPKVTRTSPRVVLEKTDVSKYETNVAEEDADEVVKPTKSTRRTRKPVAYVETDESELNTSKDTDAEDKPARASRLRTRKESDAASRGRSTSTVNSDSDNVSIASSSVSGQTDIASSTPKPRAAKKGGKKKKRNCWAMGVLPVTKRKNKSVESEMISEKAKPVAKAAEVPTSPHDINYCLDNRPKYQCKLCTHVGKFIVSHYYTQHPESEVLISRLPPGVAEAVREESKRMDYKSVEPFDEEIFNVRRDRPTFVCRFCSLKVKNEHASMFFDHLTYHTGEYRYCCEVCPFKTGMKKNLSTHYNNSHPSAKRPVNAEPDVPPPPDFRLVFGYMCGKCNYVQMYESNVEKHVASHHSGEEVEVVKINLSSKPVPAVGSEVFETAPEETPRKETDAPSVSPTPEPKPAEPGPGPVPERKPPEPEPKPVPEPEVAPKVPDLKVFLPSEKFENEEKLIEEERLKKMQEVCDTLRTTTKRTGLTFINQLKDKIEKKLASEDECVIIEDNIETIDLETLENIKKDADDEKEPEPVEAAAVAVADKPAETNTEWLTIQSVCSLADDRSSPLDAFDDPEQIDVCHLDATLPKDGTKQKGFNIIQRLAAKLQNSDVPGKTPVEHDIGGVKALVHDEFSVTFICQVDDCNFTSRVKKAFTEHCLKSHPDYDSPCKICDGPNMKLMLKFVHLTDFHCTKRDLLKKSNEDVLVIKDVRSLNGEDRSDSPKLLIRPRRLSGDLLSAATPEDDQMIVQTIPVVLVPDFGLKISEVKTLTKEEEQKLFLESKTETKPAEEVEKASGAPEIARALRIKCLYKCPSDCSYSSDKKVDFYEHIKTHGTILQSAVTCPICSVTAMNIIEYVKHIEAKHGNCPYQCPYCLFRAVQASYVDVHVRTSHPKSDVKVFKLQECPEHDFADVDPPADLKRIVFPYLCVQGECTVWV